MISYLLDVSLCWLIFYLLYYCWLSKETFFHLNRWYLLGTLLLGLIIPFVPSPFGPTVQESDWVTLYVAPISMGLESLEITVTASDTTGREFDWLLLLKWIYWSGVIITGFRFLSGLWRIGSMYRRAEIIQVGRYPVALTDEAHLPFSFFRVVFKSKMGELNAFEEEKITVHELAHVRGWHTIDVLLVELVSIFLWCSPPVHLYRRSLRIVHEYIADSAAIRTGQKKKYGHLLIRQSQSGLQLALANHFIQSQLKKRITMMTRTRSRRQAFLKYLPVIPLLVVALVVFSNWEAVAGDPANLLKADNSISFQTVKPIVADEYDPRILQKQLTAVVHRRLQVEENQDAQIAKNFAGLHDEWAAKYPEHRAEIKQIAESVADQYEMVVEFGGSQIRKAFFKKPFETVKKAVSQTISGSSEAGVKLNLGGMGDPYVLIDDQPAPANWKADLQPEDIKSIDVLKGESATEVYGEKAKDGAIRIYTKGFNKAQTIMPRFPGCEDIPDLKKREECANVNLREFLFSNLKYPEDYSKHDVQGTVIAQYTVDKNGQVKEVQILRTIGGGFSRAVEEVLENMPKMIPGTVDGVPADVKVTLPVQFRTSEEAVNESPGTPDPAVIISSLNRGAEKPLFILDGQIQESGDISNLDPEDIESIDVLKGEQALKEYGDRGEHGVVRIFTKQRSYDVAPIFPGCEGLAGEEQVKCSQKGFLMSVYKNIKYPASARDGQIEGMIVVKYTIDKDGKIKDAMIHRGIDEALDQEALRVVNDLPDWHPATKDGKAVAVDMLLPIRFKLEKDQEIDPATRTELRKRQQANKKAVIEQAAKEGEVTDEVVVVGYGSVRSRATPGEVFSIVEEMPLFPGCEGESTEDRTACAQQKMLEFVYTNISYPKAAKQAGTSGTVVASFVVAKDGTIRDINIEKGLGHGLNEQVLGVIKKMPRWIPGRQNGKAVDAIIKLPVKFKLDAEHKNPATVQVTGPDQKLSDLQELDLQNFKAAPNPTNGLINLRFQSNSRPLSVRILTANGQAVYQRELPRFNGNFDEQIDLRDAPKGTLFISIRQGDQVHTSTLILQ